MRYWSIFLNRKFKDDYKLQDVLDMIRVMIEHLETSQILVISFVEEKTK